MKIKKSDFAKRTGINKSRVSRLLKSGVLVADSEGLLDFAKSKKALLDSKQREPSRPGPDALAPGPKAVEVQGQSLHKIKIIEGTLRAKLLQVELDKLTKKLIEADPVKRQAFIRAREFRDGMLNVPAQAAPLVANESDPRKCEAIIMKIVRSNLQAVEQAIRGNSDPTIR